MLCIVISFTVFSGVSFSQEYDYAGLMERIRNDQRTTGMVYKGNLDDWVTAQNANGSWSDLQYGRSSVTNSNNHIYRLWNLAAVVSKQGHIKYNNADYKNAVKKGLEYWYGSNTVDTNWWYNKIFYPQHLGEILIFMRVFPGFIPVTSSTGIDEPELLSLFSPTAINDVSKHGTGANGVDVARHYVYRGLLTEDSGLLEGTRDKVDAFLTENMGSDMIYQDHGPQIQISSYGYVLCDGLMRLVYYLSGSPASFDLNSENYAVILKFIRETQLSSKRGRSWDFGVMGRAVSRKNALYGGLGYLYKLIDIDPANAQIYTDALARLNGSKPPNYNVREFNKHYWASDYTQHARNGYLFTVRNTSTRTVEAETGNGENLKANYFSYGANFISVVGDEYINIMPVWDWCMVPGTTFPYTTTFPSRKNWGTNFGNTSFVGGVSDGEYGASVLDMNKAGIVAKKSWFFFNDEIVCLGAGITDNSSRNVRTTINQCWMENSSYVCEDGSTDETIQGLSSSTYNNTNLKYIRHGKFAYFFPDQENVKYTMKSQTGTWKSININGSTTSQSGSVFSLWIDHGTNPAGADYSYVVVPGIDTKQKANSYDLSTVKIVENSSLVQAVYHSALNIFQVIFHQAGTVTYGDTSVTVDKPCALILKNGTIVTVSDPAQTNNAVQVDVNVDGTEYSKNVPLPITNTIGASETVDMTIPSLLADCNHPVRIPKNDWSLVYADSEEAIGEDGSATRAFDGDINTYWCTQWNPTSAPYPHEIQIDLGREYNIHEFSYVPRQNQPSGRIADYEIYISDDTQNWGTAVSTGTWPNSTDIQTLDFGTSIHGRYFRLRALSEVDGNPWTTLGEIILKGCYAESTETNFEDTNNDIVAFPMPTNGVVNISLPAKERFDYKIYSLTGHVMSSGVVEGLQDICTFDLSNYILGLYVIHLVGNDGVAYSVRVVKN